MDILLIGYGKMGKEIEALAVERNHTIVGKISKTNASDLSNYNSTNTDVAIEFSEPDSAFKNLQYCVNNNIPVLSGTTGWLDKKKEIETLTKEKGSTFFYASNYSIGVNLFFQLNKQLAELMSTQKQYKASIKEIHHTQKKDAPSGTAITLAEGIIEKSDYKNWSLEEKSNEIIPIEAVREDPAPGTHTIKYASEIDDIEITHTAHSRKGFAMGAVLVAEWLQDKKGVLSMADFLKDLKINN
ncbi:4-hydroxy-tetrahydrodipicolinate reductase [Fulvivirga lutea]|uniref:4-hydroxy-tetrahydrodipicolinate reductase n=1 Tax=Fulvivirga lutea TaxID=2810512 RepID=A0A974WDK8_9BACT|nr:4-hydroxy-tetrahydrodipicolinate reductase [Fulvivirga lutea]QSE96134.1 4-hydroxy-tetrahydrodipicolinate reductase [Fulvivirga lutea]